MATEFPSFDFSKIELPKLDTHKLVEALRDAAYITVGLGVLAFQKSQEASKDLAEPLTSRFNMGKTQVEELRSKLEKSFADLDARLVALEGKLDEAVEGLEARLPEQAGAILSQAHDVAKSARKQVRELFRSAA